VGINESLRPQQAFSWYHEGKAGANYIKASLPAIKTPVGEKKKQIYFHSELMKNGSTCTKGSRITLPTPAEQLCLYHQASSRRRI